MTIKINIGKKDKLEIYFEGHYYRIEYNDKTNESLKMTKYY